MAPGALEPERQVKFGDSWTNKLAANKAKEARAAEPADPRLSSDEPTPDLSHFPAELIGMLPKLSNQKAATQDSKRANQASRQRHTKSFASSSTRSAMEFFANKKKHLHHQGEPIATVVDDLDAIIAASEARREFDEEDDDLMGAVDDGTEPVASLPVATQSGSEDESGSDDDDESDSDSDDDESDQGKQKMDRDAMKQQRKDNKKQVKADKREKRQNKIPKKVKKRKSKKSR
jgi:hypothetical protein